MLTWGLLVNPQEVFRQHRGLQLLALVEEVLPRHSGHHGDWHISLSKPSEKEQHLLMTLVGEQGERSLRAHKGSATPESSCPWATGGKPRTGPWNWVPRWQDSPGQCSRRPHSLGF